MEILYFKKVVALAGLDMKIDQEAWREIDLSGTNPPQAIKELYTLQNIEKLIEYTPIDSLVRFENFTSIDKKTTNYALLFRSEGSNDAFFIHLHEPDPSVWVKWEETGDELHPYADSLSDLFYRFVWDFLVNGYDKNGFALEAQLAYQQDILLFLEQNFEFCGYNTDEYNIEVYRFKIENDILVSYTHWKGQQKPVQLDFYIRSEKYLPLFFETMEKYPPIFKKLNPFAWTDDKKTTILRHFLDK